MASLILPPLNNPLLQRTFSIKFNAYHSQIATQMTVHHYKPKSKILRFIQFQDRM